MGVPKAIDPRHKTWRAPRKADKRWFVNDYLRRWQADGVWRSIHQTLLMADREWTGREASPAAAIIDSQSVRSAAQKGDPKVLTRIKGSTAANGTF